MSSEQADGLPEDLDAWVADRAAATGESRPEIVRRLLAAHRLLDEHPELFEDGTTPDPAAVRDALNDGAIGPETDGAAAAEAFADSDADTVANALEDLVSRIAELEAELDEKITDVRERVIQVKRETDAKAPADHDHPDLERRLEGGFENYEEVLQYLTDLSDDHDAKLDTLASVIADVRERVTDLERRANERDAAASLRREANRHGVTTAKCGACGEAVHLGLLDSPYCPHCEATFEEIDPKRGFFGSNRLTVGQRPALEAGTDAEDDSLGGFQFGGRMSDSGVGVGSDVGSEGSTSQDGGEGR
ncbi:CopG family transcriptional regulator [Halobellus rubicundus]|uniref:CopG family transcriptional regulator n=1 Tax=Halobellus rubicundus TaxID=2996466 RepID=A0ABD5MC04_9EURY